MYVRTYSILLASFCAEKKVKIPGFQYKQRQKTGRTYEYPSTRENTSTMRCVSRYKWNYQGTATTLSCGSAIHHQPTGLSLVPKIMWVFKLDIVKELANALIVGWPLYMSSSQHPDPHGLWKPTRWDGYLGRSFTQDTTRHNPIAVPKRNLVRDK